MGGWTLIVLLAATVVITATSVSPQGTTQKTTGNEVNDLRTEFLMILDQVFRDEQPCVPYRTIDITRKRKLVAAEEKLQRQQRTLRALFTFAATAPTVESAQAPHPNVAAKMNTSQVLTCESQGQQLTACLWGRTIKGKREEIFIDEQTVQDGGRTDVSGISYVGNGLDAGNCSIRIESIMEDDVGMWCCTLLTNDGRIFKGEVDVHDADKPLRVFFGTDRGEGIRVYSESTSDVRTLISNNEDLKGLTFDWINNKIYYATYNRIYAANEDGTGVQTVCESTQYKDIWGLAFDWIAKNLYGVSHTGYVFVCRTTTNGKLACTNLLTGQGSMQGIAVDPNKGKMYWTAGYSAGVIMSAEMDGSGRGQVVTGLNGPEGIAIDYDASRMFWVESLKICSSNLDGTDVRTIVTFPSHTGPYGIALHINQIYWGNYRAKSLQRSTKSGQDIRTVFKGTRPIRHLTTTSRNFPTTRQNHCEHQNCSSICVLTSSAFRCIL